MAAFAESPTRGAQQRAEIARRLAPVRRRDAFRALLRDWAGWPADAADSLADALAAAGPAPPPPASSTAGRQAAAQGRRRAAAALDRAIAAGLERREGRTLAPALVIAAEDARDVIAYAVLRSAREQLAAVRGEASPLRVCAACTVVHRPARKSRGAVRYCPACAKLPAGKRPTLPLGMNPDWQAAAIRTRIPIGPDAGRVRTGYARECAKCGDPFTARTSTAKVCRGCGR